MRNVWLGGSVVVAIAMMGLSNPARADAIVCVDGDVCPGYDLFSTVVPETVFDNIPFRGVPLGSFTFGGFGTFSTGSTDTIVQRLNTALAGGSTPVVIDALQTREHHRGWWAFPVREPSRRADGWDNDLPDSYLRGGNVLFVSPHWFQNHSGLVYWARRWIVRPQHDLHTDCRSRIDGHA